METPEPTPTPDAAISLNKVIRLEGELSEAQEAFEADAELVTIVFIDLEGSTEYRRAHGPRKGLEKALNHNILVTQAIEAFGGKTAKWIGDGVLGYFRKEEVGKRHTFLAVCAAVHAIDLLQKRNQAIGRLNWEHHLHAKIGISSGAVHFIAGHNKDATDAVDPMGSPVDLAARLQSMASRDVIAIDKGTFLGHDARNHNGDKVGWIPGACSSKEPQIPWQELVVDGIRSTEYVPKCAPFFLDLSAKLEESKSPIDLVASGFAPRPDAVTADELKQNASREWRSEKNGTETVVLYGSQPISRNAKGFSDAVDVVALALEPRPEPLSHVPHVDKKTDRISEMLEEGENCLKRNELDAALERFDSVLREDARHFWACFRTAQIHHLRANNEEAMQYIMRAKFSHARVPIVWKLAGIIHLEDFLDVRKRAEPNVLDRAITGFTRAKALGRAQFDTQMEQCCSGLLALSFFLRAAKDDVDNASEQMANINWDHQTYIIRRLQPILLAFRCLAEGGEAAFEKARKSAADAGSSETPGHEEEAVGMPVLHERDFLFLLNTLNHRIKDAEIAAQF